MLSISDVRQGLRDAELTGKVVDGQPEGGHSPALALSGLLRRFQHCQASARAGKIFALLSLANDVRDVEGTLLFKPDYSKAVNLIHAELTRFMMQ